MITLGNSKLEYIAYRGLIPAHTNQAKILCGLRLFCVKIIIGSDLFDKKWRENFSKNKRGK